MSSLPCGVFRMQKVMMVKPQYVIMFSGGSKGVPPARPLRTKIFLISCSFFGISGTFICWRSPPGCAPDVCTYSTNLVLFRLLSSKVFTLPFAFAWSAHILIQIFCLFLGGTYILQLHSGDHKLACTEEESTNTACMRWGRCFALRTEGGGRFSGCHCTEHRAGDRCELQAIKLDVKNKSSARTRSEH